MLDVCCLLYRCEDDLTHKLVEIVRANNTLKRMVANGSPQHIINEYVQLLQFHVTTYMDNTMPGMNPATQRSGRPIKSISQVKCCCMPCLACVVTVRPAT